VHTFSLSGSSWQFRDATERSGWKAALVPGCVHRDLLRAKLIPDPFWAANETGLQWIEERVWEYRRSFVLPASLHDESTIELVADGLDTLATITLNGTEVARTENMFLGFRWDVKSLLRPGKNELVIRFDSAMEYIRTHRTGHQPKEFNDPVGRSQVIRKEQCQFGWDWGPRFVTAGIWQDIRLEAWSANRLVAVRVNQEHRENGSVRLEFDPEFALVENGSTVSYTLSLDGKTIAEGEGNEVVVDEPQLWWPAGHGLQSLYKLRVTVRSSDGTDMGSWSQRIGLRTIALDRHADEWGESFQFVVNGRALFAKGANWIPAHSFVAGLARSDYERDLRAAVLANMNIIRVWGGGIYETEEFYDICDELGLLVWQDFMFACARYPGDPAFLESVRAEARFQVRRLRHRASLALWCGNNEIWALNVTEIEAQPKFQSEYQALFHQTLPEVVSAEDGSTAYWPSSPWRGDREHNHAAGEARGDTHFWDVWHSRMPVKDYEKYAFRFVSEFGMQSYSSPATNATFAPRDESNVFGATMENHQKNRGGNQVILDYVSRRYRFPKGQDELIYLSQLNQAYCMQTGVEHWRRNMPRSMGALYWQLNDCWPVASWSSIEFTGRWRALHHVARRFFAPAIVSAHVPGEETTIIGNYRRTTVRDIHLYTVYDAPKSATGVLRWDLFHVDGRKLKAGTKRVALEYGKSVLQTTLDASTWMEKYGRDNVVLRVALEVDKVRVSEETVFLAPPRFIALRPAKTTLRIKSVSPNEVALTLISDRFQHRFAFELEGIPHLSSDNFFDLYPGETKIVTLKLGRKVTPAQLKAKLKYRSLVDTY
jgi:beta-mannosidase